MPRRRTGAELLARAEEAANERQRRAVEARDRARRAYLDALIPRLPALWAEADAAASEQKGTAYGRACGLLVDMRAAYDHAGRRPEFDTGFARFLAQHGRRQALVRRLKEAGLL